MILSRFLLSTAILAPFLFTLGCASADKESASTDDLEHGSLALLVGQAPPDARCLRVMVAGITSAQRSTDLVAGQNATLLFSGLPVGNVSITAQAYAVSCATVTQETPASWVTANPVGVLIRPALTTQVALGLQRSGGISISVSFVEPGDGGMADGALPSDGGMPSAPGVQVALTSGSTTTESGMPATFSVRLLSAPTASVSIGLSSNDISEGTVSLATVVFSAANWSSPQLVTVTGVDDDIVDGNQAYQIITSAAVSADPNYNGFNAIDVFLVNLDNDQAGVLVTQPASNSTSEAGAVATFTMRLTSKPQANVLIPLSSSDTTEGTVFPASLTFTTADWNSPKVVTVTGVDDAIVDGTQTYSVLTGPAQSTDLAFNGLNAEDVAFINLDNDVGQARTALVIVGAIPLSAGDQAVVSRLSSNLGFSVASALAAATTTASASGYSLVVVSESVTSADVGTKLTTLTSPIINGEPALQDELGMTGTTFGTQQGTDAMQNSLVIVNPASPIAAGLSGTVTVTGSAATFAWGQPAAQAVVIAQAAGGPSKSSIYTYNAGASMWTGIAAGGRAMFPATGAAAAALNANGWALFDALVKAMAPSPKSDGAACTIGGECQSGMCSAGVCQALKSNGAACTIGSECQSGMCSAGVCQALKSNGSSCVVGNECQSGICSGGLCQ